MGIEWSGSGFFFYISFFSSGFGELWWNSRYAFGQGVRAKGGKGGRKEGRKG